MTKSKLPPPADYDENPEWTEEMFRASRRLTPAEAEQRRRAARAGSAAGTDTPPAAPTPVVVKR